MSFTRPFRSLLGFVNTARPIVNFFLHTHNGASLTEATATGLRPIYVVSRIELLHAPHALA